MRLILDLDPGLTWRELRAFVAAADDYLDDDRVEFGEPSADATVALSLVVDPEQVGDSNGS